MFVQLPDRPGKGKAVHPRHHDIRHNQIVGPAVEGLVGGLGVQNAGGLKAAVVEIYADGLVQFGIVVHHQNVNHKSVPFTLDSFFGICF